MIGIIGAMDIEVDGIKSAMNIEKTEFFSSMEFCVGTLYGTECVVARCSPGKVNAAVCVQTMILKYSPRVIINSGVAGGIGHGVHIGDLVVGSSCVQHDFDTHLFGDEVGFVSGVNITNFPCSKEYSDVFLMEAKSIYEGNVFSGVIVTGDQFIADGEKCLELRDRFDAKACEMESGSIAHVCYLNNLPFVALRSISDNANETGSVDFLSFAKESADKLIRLLHETINKI